MLVVTSFDIMILSLIPPCQIAHCSYEGTSINRQEIGIYSRFWSAFYSTDVDYLMREQILWNMHRSGPSWIIHRAVLHRKERHSWGWGWRKRKRDEKSKIMEHVGPFLTRSLITNIYPDLVRSSLTLSHPLQDVDWPIEFHSACHGRLQTWYVYWHKLVWHSSCSLRQGEGLK